MIGSVRSRAEAQSAAWEIPAAVASVVVVLAVLILPGAQGLAAWLDTGRFTWPHGSAALLRSIGGILTGHPGRGLPPSGPHFASTSLIYLIIAVAELVLSAGTGWAIVLWWRHLGPGAVQGMASRADAETVLGLSNLTRRRHLIRPDLNQQPK